MSVYMKIHFGRNDIFSIRCMVNLLHLFTWNTQNESHCWCYFIAVILTEMKFHFGWCYVNTTPKMKSPKRKNLCMWIFHKKKYIRPKDQNKNRFHFILPALKTIIDRFSFLAKPNFISSLVKTASVSRK